ncbi:hypothetical protein FLONG3_5130 [Fusarium longipes]|uniref:Uncharacterized protein n=1 Tax=Fusarium longipes TaxID=694270 RepID=A0A395SW19_9HYPO|nr:hypothetical protein FLONG3_5130 [Fusarium longipes]
MSSSAHDEKSANVNEPSIKTTPEAVEDDDDWEIVAGKESQQLEEQSEKVDDLEKGPADPKKEMTEEERKRELTKAKWTGMQQQAGGVYPPREVKIPSYGQFIGDW